LVPVAHFQQPSCYYWATPVLEFDEDIHLCMQI
jgi:hypothetical protein